MSDFWQTPRYILDRVDELFPDLWFDPCPANPQFDGLSLFWGSSVYINPPFSQYAAWVEHGLKQTGDQLWMTHHKHDTQWFQALMAQASAMCLLKDRVKFIDPATGKPNGIARDQRQTLLFISSGGETPVYQFARYFSDLGKVVQL